MLAVDFWAETIEVRRQWDGILNVQREKKNQTGILSENIF